MPLNETRSKPWIKVLKTMDNILWYLVVDVTQLNQQMADTA